MRKQISDIRYQMSGVRSFSCLTLCALRLAPYALRLTIFLLLTSYILPLTPASGAGKGTTGAQFLQIAPGARAVAMGEAFVARADDLTALWWNPAGLATLPSKELYLSYYRWFEGINYGFAGYGQPLQSTRHKAQATDHRLPVIAGAITTLQATGIQGTEEAEVGTLETPFYEIISNKLTVGDYAASLGYARKIGSNLSIGAVAKFIYSELADETAYGGALDLGILYQLGPKTGTTRRSSPTITNVGVNRRVHPVFTCGAVVQNIGPRLRYHAVGDPLPLTVRVGFCWQVLASQLNNLSIAADLNIPRYAYLKIPNKIDTNIKLNLGAEYWFRKLIAARLGYKVNYDTDWLTCGLGVSFRGYQLDYAYAPFHILGDTHRISFSLRF